MSSLDGGDGGDVSTLRGKLSLLYRSIVTCSDSFLFTPETLPPSPPSPPWDDAGERDAIQNDDRYEVRQTIPQEQMVSGLLRVFEVAGMMIITSAISTTQRTDRTQSQPRAKGAIVAAATLRASLAHDATELVGPVDVFEREARNGKKVRQSVCFRRSIGRFACIVEMRHRRGLKLAHVGLLGSVRPLSITDPRRSGCRRQHPCERPVAELPAGDGDPSQGQWVPPGLSCIGGIARARCIPG